MRYYSATLPFLGPFQRPQIRFAIVVLGLCVFACSARRPVLGQAQLAAAETCFDQEPGISPSVYAAPVPRMRSTLSGRLNQLLTIFGARQAKSQPENATPAPRENIRAKNRLVAELKNSEGPLTALR